MSEPARMSSELLEDYVAGRLGTVRQAEIAGLLLDDPEAAEQVMRLRQQGDNLRRPVAANDERPVSEATPEETGGMGRETALEKEETAPAASATVAAVADDEPARQLRRRLVLVGIVAAAFVTGTALGWLAGTNNALGLGPAAERLSQADTLR